MKHNAVSGVFRFTRKGAGVLLDPALSFRSRPDAVAVPAGVARDCGLCDGALIQGSAQAGRHGAILVDVETISGMDPGAFQQRRPYTSLTAVDPAEPIVLGASGEVGMRIVDLIAPIGKGTRGLIVSPPKAGKTVLLEQIAKAVHASNPETRVILLLIDERPEEVTWFRRSVPAEVLYSSSDQSIQEHIDLVELTLAHIRTELECGRDVVVLVDSITRMGRAFNHKGSGPRRILSGGLEAGALEFPRRFFGLARNIENGGSVTIIATALIDTGSRMDQLIFEEFKGTGNSEIVLDRSLAEAHIFPAINLRLSGTRKEERLYKPGDVPGIAGLRRLLSNQRPREAMETLLKLLERYPSNAELLRSLSAPRA